MAVVAVSLARSAGSRVIIIVHVVVGDRDRRFCQSSLASSGENQKRKKARDDHKKDLDMDRDRG